MLGEVATSTSPADPLTPVPGVLSLPPLLLVLLAARPGLAGGGPAGRARGAAARARPAAGPGRDLGRGGVGAGLVGRHPGGRRPTPTACAARGRAARPAARRWPRCCPATRAPCSTGCPARWTSRCGGSCPPPGWPWPAGCSAGAVLLSAGPARCGCRRWPTSTPRWPPGSAAARSLLLLQVAYLPTAVVWAASVLAGPGTVARRRPRRARRARPWSTCPPCRCSARCRSPGRSRCGPSSPRSRWSLAGALAAWHAHRHPSSRGRHARRPGGRRRRRGRPGRPRRPRCSAGWRRARSARGSRSARSRSCSPGP